MARRRGDYDDDDYDDYDEFPDEEVHLSPYEEAEEREPGSGQALLDAAQEYYDQYPEGHPDLAEDPSLAVNWYDPESYGPDSWMYNTAEPSAEPSAEPPPPPDDDDDDDDEFDPSRVPEGIDEDWARDFIANNPGDYDRMYAAYHNITDTRGSRSHDIAADEDAGRGDGGGGDGGGGGESRNMSQWLGQSYAPPPPPDMSGLEELLKGRFETIAAEEAENKARRDALYETLLSRSQEDVEVDPESPNIKRQVDAFRAAQERSQRGYISDIAEKYGPLANTIGEQRIAAERTGQNVSTFQAELLTRSLSGKRDKIMDALRSMGNMLTADQSASIQREVANIDDQIAGLQVGIARDELGLRRELGFGDLDLRRELGKGDLSLREAMLEAQNERFFADLGFRAADRGSYWDYLRGGGTL